MLKDFQASATQDGPEDFLILANWKQGDAHPRSATWSCTGKDECDELLTKLNHTASEEGIGSLEVLEEAVGKRAATVDGRPR